MHEKYLVEARPENAEIAVSSEFYRKDNWVRLVLNFNPDHSLIITRITLTYDSSGCGFSFYLMCRCFLERRAVGACIIFPGSLLND